MKPFPSTNGVNSAIKRLKGLTRLTPLEYSKRLSDLINSFDTKILENIKKELQSIGISKIDYCEVREESNLEISKTNLQSRLFLAFYVNKVRIIDNFVLY